MVKFMSTRIDLCIYSKYYKFIFIQIIIEKHAVIFMEIGLLSTVDIWTPLCRLHMSLACYTHPPMRSPPPDCSQPGLTSDLPVDLRCHPDMCPPDLQHRSCSHWSCPHPWQPHTPGYWRWSLDLSVELQWYLLLPPVLPIPKPGHKQKITIE